jgi:archaellum component FlaC
MPNERPIEKLVGEIKLIQMSIKVIANDINEIKKKLQEEKKEPVKSGWFY